MSGSPWIGHSEPRVNTHYLARRGEELIDRIERHGVAVPPDNRLTRAIRTIDQWNENYRAGKDVCAEDLQEQRLFLEAHKVLMEALVVVFARDERPAGMTAIDAMHLRSLLEGPELSQDGKPDSARDLQFEAYVGASLVLAGLSVTKGEPDYILLYHGQSIGVAAKRLTSRKPEKLYDRLREAHSQIRDSTGVGFVAVNLDSWGEGPLQGNSPEEFGAGFRTELREAYKQIGKLADRPALLGAIIFRSWHGFDFDGNRPSFRVQTAQQVIAFAEHEDEERRVREFFDPALLRLKASHATIGALLNPPSNALGKTT